MKHIAFFVCLLTVGIAAHAQTALYKHYANRQGIKAYCVERYPLSCGDIVTVTFFEAEDKEAYDSLRSELIHLPYTPRRGSIDGTVEYNPSPRWQQVREKTEKKKAEKEMKKREKELHIDSLRRIIGLAPKHLVVFNADAFPGDEGYYAIYCPSDRMVILIFHITSDDEALKVAGHMMSSELKTEE